MFWQRLRILVLTALYVLARLALCSASANAQEGPVPSVAAREATGAKANASNQQLSVGVPGRVNSPNVLPFYGTQV